MIISYILTLSSYLLFIYIAYYLLTTVVDWAKIAKVYPENQRRLRLLILFLSITIGSFVTQFFLTLLTIGSNLAFSF